MGIMIGNILLFVALVVLGIEIMVIGIMSLREWWFYSHPRVRAYKQIEPTEPFWGYR